MTKPKPFHGFIGQRSAVRLIKRQAEGSKLKSRPFPNTLLTGPSGLGKTELAKALAREMGTELRVYTSHAQLDLSEILAGFRSQDHIFLDEAHALTRESQEMLYSYLDAGSAVSVAASGALPMCSFIFATDQEGKLTNALLKRIPITIPFEPYAEEELIDIIAKMSSAYHITTTAQSLRLLAQSSQGNPRLARHRIQCLSQYASVPKTNHIEQFVVKEFLEENGVDCHFRSKPQFLYLRSLFDLGGTASVETIAGQIGSDRNAIERQVEPYLLKKGWIHKSSQGRILTDSGKASLVDDPQTPITE